MKIRRSIFLFIVAVAALIALVLWHGKKKLPETAATVAIKTNAPSLPATTATNTPVRSNAPVVKTTKGADLSKSPPMSKVERAIGLLSDYNDEPIVFYGKIEDQFSNAVANATVNFGVRVMNGYESTVKSGQITSDTNGLFTISGYKGQDLGIGIVKHGYAWVSMNGSGNYSLLAPEAERAHPDQNNPVVIKMWKLQGAKPLVGINCQFKFPYTDAPIYFDLIAGKIVPAGGDIKVTVNRSPGVISVQNRVNWNVEIEAVDGGLMDPAGTERITYFAPESGYEPSRIIHSTDRLPEGGLGGFHTGFYVKSRNGQVYSKLGLSFRINLSPDDPIYIRFSGIANTNGSRNWEGDSNTYNATGQ